MSSKEILGYQSEKFVRELFAKGGFQVTDMWVSRQGHWETRPTVSKTNRFDFVAEKEGGEIYFVKVRTTRAPTGRLSADMVRNQTQIANAMHCRIPKGAVRLLWHHSLQYDEHATYLYTPEGFKPTPNPLAHLLPPPLPRKPRGAPRKYDKETGERIY